MLPMLCGAFLTFLVLPYVSVQPQGLTRRADMRPMRDKASPLAKSSCPLSLPELHRWLGIWSIHRALQADLSHHHTWISQICPIQPPCT